MKILLLVTFLAVLLMGDHSETASNYDEKKSSLLEKTLHKSTQVRTYLSERFTTFSTSVDNFLADEPDDELYENNSFIHLQYAFEKIEHQSSSNKFDIKVRIQLPKTKERYKIEIESIDNTNDDSKDSRIDDVNKNEDIGAGVGYAKQLKESVDFSAGLGVRLKLNDIDPYAKVKIKKTFNKAGDWKSDLAQKVYLFEKRGLESTSSYEIYNVFNDTLKFSNYNEYFWKEKVRDDNFYNSLRLYQNISKKDYLSYITSVSTNNNESNLQTKDIQAYVSYRHYFKEWIYYDVIPKVLWVREDNFETKYGFRVNLGMFFGKRKN